MTVDVLKTAFTIEFESYADLDEKSSIKYLDDGSAFAIAIRSSDINHWTFNRQASIGKDHALLFADALAASPPISNPKGQLDERIKLHLSINESGPNPFLNLSNGFRIENDFEPFDLQILLREIYPHVKNDLLEKLGERLKKTATKQRWVWYVIKTDFSLAAAAALFFCPIKKMGWLGWAMVGPQFRQYGLYGALLDRRIAKARDMGLTSLFSEVSPDTVSEGMLKKHGFKSIHHTRYEFLESVSTSIA